MIDKSTRIVRLVWGLLAASCILLQPALSADPAPNPDPARFEKEIARFEQTDREHPPATGQIVFVGSSSIRKWDLKKSFPSLDALNRGFGGSIIADSNHFFPRIILPYRPRQVVFYAGDNDLASGKKSPQAVLEDFQKFVAMLHQQLPETSLVYISIKPSIKRWNLIGQIRETNGLIKTACAKDPLTTFLDVEPAMLNEQGQPRPELFAADGLHMSDAGYIVWTKLLIPYLTPDQRASRLINIYDEYHGWTPPATLKEWQQVSQQIREQVLVASGLWPMPSKSELQPVIHGLVDRGDYTIERVYFASMPGLYVTGNLYRPKHVTGKIPAVLCPHGHWPEGRFTNNSPQVIEQQLNNGGEQFASGGNSPLQARMIQLARMGCIVFHYDMIGYADNGPLEHRGDFADADAALWLHNKLGLHTWNSIRSLDFVTSLPDVDSARIGITGASGGGTQTFLLSAIDPRIAVAFPAVMVSTGMQGGCTCENADYLRVGINNIALAALTAPRPLAMSGADDWTIAIETKGLPELRHIYGLYGQADFVNAKAYPQFTHNYNQVAREMMFNWFNTHLQLGLATPIHQTDFWPLTKAEMTVFDERHPRPADGLKEAELRDQLRTRDKQVFQALLTGDEKRFREVIATAGRVLLPAMDAPVQIEPYIITSAEPAMNNVRHFVVTYDKARVPVALAEPTPAGPHKSVVLWLDGKGKSHLHAANGQFDPAIQTLLDAGHAMAAADLFLTGDDTGMKDLYSNRLDTPSPHYVSKSADKEYTGYVYGYNRTLLAERVRDIQAVVRALQEMQFSRITIVGSGEAGLWTLLSRAGIPTDAVDNMIADLQGFTFSGIKVSKDPDLVPGALKYGGIGGLAALAFPAKLTIFGAGNEPMMELAPLVHTYQPHPEKLTISDKPLSRATVAELIAK